MYGIKDRYGLLPRGEIMAKNTLDTTELLREPFGVLNRRLTAFTFSKRGETYTIVNIFGSFNLKPFNDHIDPS